MRQSLTSRRRWIAWSLRALVLVLVGVGVSGTIRNALAQLSQYEWQLRPGWLVISGALYSAGLVPMAWFWHRALGSLGQPAPWRAALRAYFLGHLGKYVPGKALAVILRVAAVRQWVSSIRIAIASSLLETLTMMAAGAFLAAVLSIFMLHLDWRLGVLAAGMALAVGLPTLPPVARWLARLGARRLKQADAVNLAERANGIEPELARRDAPGRSPDDTLVDAPTVPADIAANLGGLDLRLLATGWVAAGVCWLLLGLSLWATLRSMGVAEIDPIGDLPLTVASVAFAVVAGFASMLPGGLVVRDALLMQLLAPTCGAAGALVAAVLLRLVWLVSELTVCVILYLAAKFY